MGKGSGSCDDRPALAIYGLSDLHLGPGAGKGHYSSGWVDHQSKLRKNWDKRIGDDDVVLLPGDFSWYKDPADLEYDYYWLNRRPGKIKVLSPGNHDYGVWNSEAEANEFLEQFSTETAVMDNAIRIKNPLDPDGAALVVAAAQGSQSPGDKYFNTNAGASAQGKENESVRFLGELVALDQAIRHGQAMRRPGDALIVMIHYPPFANGKDDTVFSKMIERSGADLCVYGHLHQKEQFRKTVQGERNGVEYRFVGADFLRFSPTKLAEWTRDGIELAPIEVVGRDAWPEEKMQSTSKSSAKPSPSSPKKDVQATNSSGNKLTCSECEGPIFESESFHWSPHGPIHDTSTTGKVAYGQTGTCPHKKFKSDGKSGASSASAKRGVAPNGSSNAGSKTKPSRMIWDKTLPKGVFCEDCGRPFNVGERYHMTKTGAVHGAGVFGQRNTCFLRDRNNATPKSSGRTPKPTGKCAVCAEAVGPNPHRFFTRLPDDTLVCKECFDQVKN